MTEHNTFCWSKTYDDDDSFQQKSYRIFNVDVSGESYFAILKQIKSIIPNFGKLKLYDFWKTITQDQVAKLMEIPHFDEKGFEYITGIKL